MQNAKNKTVVITIAILLIISMGASMLLIPNISAHTPPYQVTTYAKVVALPNPIGVGQSALVYSFLGKYSSYQRTVRKHLQKPQLHNHRNKPQRYKPSIPL